MPSPRPLVFLHGLFGSPDDWKNIADEEDICLTLPGHCHTKPAPIEAILEMLPETCDLVGYSMGGRIAMQLKCLAPKRIKHLTILSAHPGIVDETIRAKRLALDFARAEKIRTQGLPQFLKTWYNGDLFASLKAMANFDEIFARRTEHNERDLARALEIYSVGHQPPLWEELLKYKLDTRFIFGATDFTYEPVVAELKKQGHQVIMQTCGHAMHLEVPMQTKQIIKRTKNDNSRS